MFNMLLHVTSIVSYLNCTYPHSGQVWIRSGVKQAACWHGKWFGNQIWAMCGNNSSVFKMVCNKWPGHGLVYVMSAGCRPMHGGIWADYQSTVWAKTEPDKFCNVGSISQVLE